MLTAPGESLPQVHPPAATAAASAVPPSSGFCVEVMCGSAKLTRALRSQGFDAIGVDHSRNKHTPCGPVVNFDLTKAHGKELLTKLFRQGRVKYVHLGPPCGTSSRAREKPVPKAKRREGAPQPPPLRSEEHPEGLPQLWLDPPPKLFTLEHRVRVEKANVLYALTAEIATWCATDGVAFSIENPERSWFWFTPAIAALAHLPGVFDVDFAACNHGGQRPE